MRTRFPHIKHTRKKPIPFDNDDMPHLRYDKEFQTLSTQKKQFLYLYISQPFKSYTLAEAYCKSHNLVMGKDISEQQARIKSSTFLKKRSTKSLINKIKNFHTRKNIDLFDRVLKEETRLAFSDITEVLDDNGLCVVNPKTLPKRVRSVIKSFKMVRKNEGLPNESVKWELSFYDKNAALDRLQKIHGMRAAEKIELSGGIETTGTHNINHTVTHKFDLSALSLDEIKTLQKIQKKLARKK